MFGSKYLIKRNKNKKFKADIVVKKSGIFGEISYDKLMNILGGCLEDVIEANKNSHEQKKLQNNAIIIEKSKSIKMKQLIFVRKLG